MTAQLADRTTDRFRQAVLDAADHVSPTASGRAMWRALGDAGLIKRFGEPVADVRSLDALLSELDRSWPLGTVLSVCVQVALAVPLLRSLAGESATARDVLSDVVAGRSVVAVAASEAGLSGSDLLDMSTSVEQTDEGRQVNGAKAWITNAGDCDYLLVLARHRPGRHFTAFCWALVPAGTPGVSVEPATTRLFTGAAVGHPRFAGVTIGADGAVGRSGRAMADFARQLAMERLAGALWARSLCRRVLRQTLEYLRQRRTGSGTLWDNDAVRERFGRALVALAGLDALCIGNRTDGTTMVAGATLKVVAGETVRLVLDECVALHGAEAFADQGLSQLREEAAMFGIAGGTIGAMLAAVAVHADQILANR